MKTFSKRLLTMLLAAAMVFSLSGMTAFAAEEDTSGGGISTYEAGEEPTLNNDGYYEIATPGNLVWFADQVDNQNNWSINGILTDDIDVSDLDDFSPIGKSSSYSYEGIFNGAGHTVKLNLTDSTADYQALFGSIENATVSSVTVDGSVSGKQYVAGVIGRASDSTITGCVNKAAVTSTGNYTAGVVGSTDTNITDCGNDGPVTSSDGLYVGGVVGYTTTRNMEVSGCYNHGDIEGYRTVAGIIAYSSSSTNIDSCYNTGVINTTVDNLGSNTYCSAGIVGIIQEGSVSNVFNTGAIEGKYSQFMGALTGGATSMSGGHSITNGYYLEGTADAAYATSGFGYANVTLTEVSTKTAAEIASADFLDLINENDAFVRGADHPILKWEYDESGSVDKSALQAEYNEDVQMNDIGYTSERWEAFTEALKAAKTVLDTPDEELTQLEVDTALYDLQLAKSNLGLPLQNADGQYEIANVMTLEWFADQVNNEGKNSIDGIVTADIDASGSESFSPIGTTDSNFTGTFDGGGHTITLNLTDSDSDYQALFGYTYGATISNVTVDGSISGNRYVAGIIAYMNGSNISDCVNRAAITAASGYAGGVVGYDYTRNDMGFTNGTITNCGNDGAITSPEANGVGGIVGDTKADGNEATEIYGCYNHGDIIGLYLLGGIVSYGHDEIYVDSCYNTGNITETGTTTNSSNYSGGLVGVFSEDSKVYNSFNMGTVTAGSETRQKSYVGSLVGGGNGTGASVRLDHVYYLEGSCVYDGEDHYYGSGNVHPVDDSVASKTAVELKEMEFLDLVNANLVYTLGTDHPILRWESEDRSPYMALREEYEDDLLLDWADWTPETWEPFEQTLEAAGELLEDPDATDEDYEQMLAALQDLKSKLVYVEPDYTVKYAVSIYDIGADVDEEGNPLGLTFGPATAHESYTRSYKAHLTQEEYEAGEGICLHWMSWKDIIRQSKENPEAFQDCLNNGCTHSIELVYNDTLLNSNYTFNRMTGDGCGILYYSIANTYLQVNYKYGDNNNYGDTTFRRTLNTESYSILSCMPEDLQNGIVAKRVRYAQKAGSTTSEVCYDKLWMFSLYELGAGGSSVEGSPYYRPTSTNSANSPDNRTYKLYNRYETGEYGDWMVPRSLYGSYDKSIYNVHYLGDDQYSTNSGSGSGGISFGFCLAGPEDDQELSAFAVYSADDSSLTFYTDYSVPTEGSTYNEKTVTKVYTDVDQTVAESADEIPWKDVRTDATDVVIDPTFADAQPTSFAYWFDGFANAAFSGTDYMNTENVTSMRYMFHDCAALTGLDLADWNTTGVAEADGVEFATGCTDLQWVKIGKDTDIFRLNQNVDQQFWYDSQANGNLVSFDYLMDVTEAGTYWSRTMETAGYITIKIGDKSTLLFYEDIDEAIAKAEKITFTCGGTPVNAQFVLLSDLIGIGDDFCSYTVTADDGSVTGGLPTDTYLYKTEDGKYRTAVNGGTESQWVSEPDTIEVVEDHVWDAAWAWNGLPLYCTTDDPDFEPLSVPAIQPWNVALSFNIATFSANKVDATATAVGTCENCGRTETSEAALSARFLSDEPTEYVGALAEITATAAFRDGQKVSDAVKVLASATGMLDVNYLRDDETVKMDAVSYNSINELINKTEPFAIHYTASGGADNYLTMPFVPITDALGMSGDENFCCFTAYGTDDFSAILPADAYLYQRNKADNSGNAYYYRTAVGTNSVRPTVRSSAAFVSYVCRVDVQYMHQWGTPEWTWSDDNTSATVTVSCTRDNGAGMVVCDYTDTADATVDVTTQNGYTVYTATATLCDGQTLTDTKTVEIPAPVPEAFAVYCAEENSLSFYVDAVPAAGDTYDGKEATEVYTGLEELSLTDAGEQPWYSYESSITDVEVDSTFADARPTSLAYWFDGFTNASFTGLEYMDITNVTSMSYMFHDCAALTGLDLADWDTAGVEGREQFATGCTDLQWVKIGENTDIFAKNQNVDQQYWYDSAEDGSLISDNYLLGVSEAGQYWTYTKPAVAVTITADGAADDISKAYDGEEITLAAEADVTPENADTTCRWYYKEAGDTEFTAIGAAADSTLTLAGNVKDSGTYQCEVTAVLGDESTTAESNEITITIGKADQTIVFAEKNVESAVGETYENKLTADSFTVGDVTYATSNESVATVGKETGKVTIVGVGTANITATAAETDNYNGTSATYTVKVEAALDSGNTTPTQVDDVVATLQEAETGSGGSGRNGLCQITAGKEWGYFKDGVVDTSYTGFQTNENGTWYVENGYIHFDKNSVYNDAKGEIGAKGAWYYVVGNKVQYTYTGVSNFANDYGWWYINNGKVDFSVNSVEENQYGWWNVESGKVVFSDTVARNRWGWWYCTGGKVDFGFSGLGNHGNAYGWWYIKNGKVDFSANTVAQNKYGWWYVEGGMVQFGYTGVANYSNPYGWWYIANGKVDFGFTGTAQNKWGTWNIVNGKVRF